MPVPPLQEAVARARAGADALAHGDLSELPLERARIVAFLVNESLPSPAVSLTADRRLDEALVDALQGNLNESDWQQGLAELRRIKGGDLAAETYQLHDGPVRPREVPLEKRPPATDQEGSTIRPRNTPTLFRGMSYRIALQGYNREC